MERMANWSVLFHFFHVHFFSFFTHDIVEWQDERPPAPSYLRVLYLGKMLLDDDTLTSASLGLSSSH